MNDDNEQLPAGVVLFMMAQVSNAERIKGTPGWAQAPDNCKEAADELVSRGLAEEHPNMPGWFRTTSAGNDAAAAGGTSVH